MSLRCQGQEDKNIHAFELSEPQWQELREVNARQKHLRMPCCDTSVVLKTSKLGTQFFAHQRKGPCTTKPESAEHLMIKSIVAKTLAQCGWDVSTEIRGQSSEGEDWVADVIASKGSSRFAVEIQWSRQAIQETYARQSRYKQSGIKALWLFRHDFPNDEDVPAVKVLQVQDGSFRVMFPSFEVHHYQGGSYPGQTPHFIGLEEFIRAVCERRFWYGVFRTGEVATANFKGAFIKCWRCEEWTNVVSEVDITSTNNPSPLTINLSELGEAPLLQELLPLDNLKQFKVGRIMNRYSKTVGGEYLANGCTHCDALQGNHFLHDITHRLKVITTHQFTITKAVEAFLTDWEDVYVEACWRLDLPDKPVEHIHNKPGVIEQPSRT